MENLFSVDGVGKLYYDRVLLESYHPILFTAKSQDGDYYICVCCLANGKIVKWLLTRVEAQTIINLLTDNITIREAFTVSTFDKYTVLLEGSKYRTIKNCTDDWSEESIFLPTAGEYIDADDGEFDAEINYFISNQDIDK